MKFQIFIPTLGRINNQKTLAVIPKEYLKNTYLVVDYCERNKHDYPRVLVCPKKLKGIAAKRAFIMKKAESRYIFVIDDDLEFAYRKTVDNVKLFPCKAKQMKRMFKLLYKWMKKDKIANVGVSFRSGNNHVLKEYIEVGRQTTLHGFDLKQIKENDIKYCKKLQFFEDYDFLLQMLEKGMKNRISYMYTYNQGSNTPGGCREQRTADTQAKAAKKLKKRHHDFVTLVTRKSRSTWKGLEERTDVRIQWKKAFNQ